MNIALDASVLAAIAIVFTAGLASGLSPCSLPTAVFVASYASGSGTPSRRRLVTIATAFVMGMVGTLTILGAIVGWLGSLLVHLHVLNYVVATIMMLTALWMLGAISFDVMLPGGEWRKARGSGAIGAFLLGIPFALTASPCAFPVALAVLAYAAARGEGVLGATLMLSFAVGRSLPLWCVATFAGMLTRLQRVASLQSAIVKAAGVVLIGMAAWLLWTA